MWGLSALQLWNQKTWLAKPQTVFRQTSKNVNVPSQCLFCENFTADKLSHSKTLCVLLVCVLRSWDSNSNSQAPNTVSVIWIFLQVHCLWSVCREAFSPVKNVCGFLSHSVIVSASLSVFRPSATVSRIGLMESCTCRRCCGGPPFHPPLTNHHLCLAWEPDGWLGRSAFTLTKRTCSQVLGRAASTLINALVHWSKKSFVTHVWWFSAEQVDFKFLSNDGQVKICVQIEDEAVRWVKSIAKVLFMCHGCCQRKGRFWSRTLKNLRNCTYIAPRDIRENRW